MISFQTDDVEMPDIDIDIIRQWIHDVARSYGVAVGDIAYVFTNDSRILDVNRQYLNHDYYTDIITFDYSTQHTISGDIFISLDTVKSNAQAVAAEYDTELHRVIIHGILHLCGIDDKGPGQRAIMETAENAALALLNK